MKVRSLITALALLSLTVQAAPAPDQQAVASAHPIATEAGHLIMDQGGNAFDAAIAVAATLAVVEPYGSGIGGGGFFLLRQAGGEQTQYRFIDARETAPLAAHRDMFLDEQDKLQRVINGPLAAGIPGTPAALAHLAEQYGRLPLSQSLAPAIAAAEQGFAVGESYRTLVGFRLAAMQQDAETARIFLRNNEAPAAGELVRQPDLAETLRQLAERGHAGFYSGPVAEKLIKGVKAAGGIWAQADLDSYRVIERDPVRFSSRGFEVITSPLPSAGGIALAGILQGMEHLPDAAHGSVQWTHQLVELMRRSYRDRAVLLGDSDFVEVPSERLLSPEHARQLAAGVNPERATPSLELGPAAPFNEGTNTTHFSLIDREGNAVAATLSVNLPFGAAFTVPGTGVLLNNEMDDFAADPDGHNSYGLEGSEANAIAPGKRPLSSMTPTMLENEQQLAVLGTPGGSRIISMVLLGTLEAMEGRPVHEWVSRPRFHHQYLPDHIQIEDAAFSAEQRRALEQLGHSFKPVGRDYGDMQALQWDKRSAEISAASDPRGEGEASARRPVTRD